MIYNIWNEICKILLILISLPKTIIFNFTYLPLKHAVKLPILIPYNLKLRCMKGSIELDDISPGIIQIGFNSFGIIVGNGDGVWNLQGHIHFKGKTRIGCHPKVIVDGTVTFGSNFQTGHNFIVCCHKRITFGSNVLLSWSVEVMDTDFHQIMDKNEVVLNAPRDIEVKSHTWVGNNVSILKGSLIQEGVIIGSHSIVTKVFQESNCLLIGAPAKVYKTNVYWKL